MTRRGSAWRARLPRLAYILGILTVAALAVTPVVMIERLEEDWREFTGEIVPALALATEVRFEVERQAAAARGYALTGDTTYLSDYREARAAASAAVGRLETLTRRIDPAVVEHLIALRRIARRWQALNDAIISGEITPEEFVERAGEQRVLFISTFAAATELQRELVRIFEVRAQALDTALSLQQTISVALGVVAIVTTVVVGWVVQRRRRLSAALARAVDEERRLREQAERREEELERVTESRARLIRGFTHDVKNPLGAADGYLQLLEEGLVDQLTEKQRASVAKARRSIGSALDLIADLLELARAETGRIDVRHEPVDLPAVLGDVVEAFRAQAEAKGLALAVEVEDGLPTIGSDADRIRQVVGNLVSNAVKYTERGGVTVRAGVRTGGRAPGPGRWIAVEVIDTGPGISRDQQRLLFQEFARLTTAAGTRGAGIGLAISRRIARALDGDITVESEEGRGSTFTLWLPLAMEEREPEARAAD